MTVLSFSSKLLKIEHRRQLLSARMVEGERIDKEGPIEVYVFFEGNWSMKLDPATMEHLEWKVGDFIKFRLQQAEKESNNALPSIPPVE